VSSEAFFDNDFQGVGGIRGGIKVLAIKVVEPGVKAGVVEQLLQNLGKERILCRTRNGSLLEAF
jgi:hypothetical protein